MPRIRTTDSSTAILDRPQPVATVDQEPPAIAPVAEPIRTAAVAVEQTAVSTPPPIPESVARRNQELRDAEPILERKVDGGQFTDTEESYLVWLFGDQAKLHGHLQRVKRRKSAQRQAGRSQERDEAKARRDKTAAELAAAQAEAAAAQQRLAKAEGAARAAVAAVEQHDAAMVQLEDPSLLSDPDRQQYQFLRQKWESRYGRPARSLRLQAENYRRLAGLDPAEHANQIASYCQSAKGLDHICKTTIQLVDPSVKSSEIRDKRFVRVDAGLWQAHAAELLQRADAAEQEAIRLESEGQALKAELDQMLESLIPS